MARAVFQVQSSSDRPTVGSIKRSSDHSLHITEGSSNIIACLPFKKSKERVEPVRCAGAYIQMLSCQVNNVETPNLVWVLLRLFSRNIIELPISSQLVTDQQIIPFWTGYFRVIFKSSPSFSKVAYPPIVDAKPTDMTTVYTNVKRCVEMCTKAGQQLSIQTFDKQLYAIAQQVK